LSRFLNGCYMDLLEAQFNNGYLTLDEIKTVLGSDYGSAWPALQKKFRKISHNSGVQIQLYNVATGHTSPFDIGTLDIFVQKRLNFEVLKRKKFTKSRRDNLNPDEGESSPHMGNENESVNLIEKRKSAFISDVSKYIDYNQSMRSAFCDYWTERKPTGKKMRFELEKVFDISRRLSTWARNDETRNKKNDFGQGKTTNGMPDHYDAAYMAKLKTGPEIQQYQQHLHSKGLRPLKNRFNDIIDWVTEDKLKEKAA
jgi:hypothetical protein